MALPADFAFSQHSLQDYVDCARRFSLRYVERLAWPAIEAEPVAEHDRQLRVGSLFHRMVHQHILGVPLDRLTPAADVDPDLRIFWQNYLEASPGDLPGRRLPEKTLLLPFAGFLLEAKPDLLVISPEGKATIFDWKTADRLPRRDWLQRRMQTRVYRFVLLQAGHGLNGGKAFAAEEISFVYWYAAFPEGQFRFDYNAGLADEDEAVLRERVEEIAGRSADDFPMTPDIRRCRFCVYRSYCDRGESAGDLGDIDEIPEPGESSHIDLDFDQIAEIEF
jgi:hypothetical protein